MVLFSTVIVLWVFPNSHKHIPVNCAHNSQTGVTTLYDLEQLVDDEQILGFSLHFHACY
jgi:hypothetical protein